MMTTGEHGIIITKAHESDAAEILQLQHIAYQSEAEIYNDFSIQPLTQTFQETLNEFKENVVLKAVMDGAIVGSVRASVKDDTVFIAKLMVLPAHQNKGIGRSLLQEIENEFPCRRYELFTGIKSEKNITLYKKCGYNIFKQEEVSGFMFAYMEKISVCVRKIIPAEYSLLEDFLYHAIFVPPGQEMPPCDIIYKPSVFVYIDGFGDKPSDLGVVAETGGKVVGAAWGRIIRAFGYVDDETPELAISVLPEFRGQGIGTAMMKHLFELLQSEGYRKTSLAVQQQNAAYQFYQRLGYQTVGKSEEDYIMVKELQS